MNDTRTPGIYMITCLVSGKKYVGSTGSGHGLRKRWSSHKHVLNQGCHANPHLQSAWNKYSEAAFSYAILEKCPEAILLVREEYWMAYHKTLDRNFGYNIRTAERHLISDETKKKMSIARLGVPLSEATRAKLRISLLGNQNSLGHKHSNESKKKMSIAMKEVRSHIIAA